MIEEKKTTNSDKGKKTIPNNYHKIEIKHSFSQRFFS